MPNSPDAEDVRPMASSHAVGTLKLERSEPTRGLSVSQFEVCAMVTHSPCEVPPCSAPACRCVVFRLSTTASRDDFENFMKVINLCANHYALTAVGRDLLQLLGITVVELAEAPFPTPPTTRREGTVLTTADAHDH
jgi:hypothetical protein